MATAFNKPAICPIFIGHTTDLATLNQLIDQVKGGGGHVALLSGEAGIDKSRLVAEVKTDASSHDFWLVLSHGSCH